MNILEKSSNKKKSETENKLPFAVFISPSISKDEREDYKQVFTDIISDRIKQKYK